MEGDETMSKEKTTLLTHKNQECLTKKMPYEAPKILWLGEIAKGMGVCFDGSGDSDGCVFGAGGKAG